MLAKECPFNYLHGHIDMMDRLTTPTMVTFMFKSYTRVQGNDELSIAFKSYHVFVCHTQLKCYEAIGMLIDSKQCYF